jgi:hypothetical protein
MPKVLPRRLIWNSSTVHWVCAACARDPPNEQWLGWASPRCPGVTAPVELFSAWNLQTA